MYRALGTFLSQYFYTDKISLNADNRRHNEKIHVSKCKRLLFFLFITQNFISSYHPPSLGLVCSYGALYSNTLKNIALAASLVSMKQSCGNALDPLQIRKCSLLE